MGRARAEVKVSLPVARGSWVPSVCPDTPMAGLCRHVGRAARATDLTPGTSATMRTLVDRSSTRSGDQPPAVVAVLCRHPHSEHRRSPAGWTSCERVSATASRSIAARSQGDGSRPLRTRNPTTLAAVILSTRTVRFENTSNSSDGRGDLVLPFAAGSPRATSVTVAPSLKTPAWPDGAAPPGSTPPTRHRPPPDLQGSPHSEEGGHGPDADPEVPGTYRGHGSTMNRVGTLRCQHRCVIHR
jgi:hypothetical protein